MCAHIALNVVRRLYALIFHLTANQPTSTPGMTAFAKACALEVDVSVRILEFPEGYIDMDNNLKPEKKKLFIRDCYPILYDKMVAMSKLLEDPSECSPVPVFILGTPGCGKSVFRMYVCNRLLQLARHNGRSVYILFQKAEEDGPKTVHVVCQKFGEDVAAFTFLKHHENQLSEFVNLHERSKDLVISLVDVTKGKYKNVAATCGHMWYFSSPNVELVNHKDRFKTPVVDLYMSLWHLKELKKARQVLNLQINAIHNENYTDPPDETSPDSIIEHRFHAFGGSARAAFENPERTEIFIKKELANVTFFEALIPLLDANPEEVCARVSHSLFHVDAGNDCKARYQWASPIIKARVADAALKTHDQKIEGFLNSEISPGAKGEILEELWFQRLVLATRSTKKSNQMALRRVGPYSNNETIAAPDQKNLRDRLRNLPEIQTKWHDAEHMGNALESVLSNFKSCEAIMLRPFEFTMMAIDGILVFDLKGELCVLLLQATIASAHRTGRHASDYLHGIVGRISGKVSVALVFVLPKSRFYSWKVQSIEGPGKNIVQFALCPGTTMQK